MGRFGEMGRANFSATQWMRGDAHRRIFTLCIAVAALAWALKRGYYDGIRHGSDLPRFPAVGRPRYPCVSYGSSRGTVPMLRVQRYETNRCRYEERSAFLSGVAKSLVEDSRPVLLRNAIARQTNVVRQAGGSVVCRPAPSFSWRCRLGAEVAGYQFLGFGGVDVVDQHAGGHVFQYLGRVLP